MIEELLISGKQKDTSHIKVKIAEENYIKWEKMEKYLDEFKKCIEKSDKAKLIYLLNKTVSGYVHYFEKIKTNSA